MAALAWVGSFIPPDYDGGMNLQMAQNLASGAGPIRDFGGVQLFPWEVQTGGAYTFIASFLIKIFGASTFVYQLPNLIFLLVLAIAVSYALRRWTVLRVIGPSTVLFAVPGLLDNAIRGYGEYVVAALVFTAIAMIAAAITARGPVLLATIALVLLSISITVKVVAMLAVPVLLVGLVGLAVVRTDVRRWKWLVALVGLLVPFAANELYRFLAIGSMQAYKTYWHEQFLQIGGQSGVTESGQVQLHATPRLGLLKTITGHLHILHGLTGISAAVLCLVIVLPFGVLAALFVARRSGWRDWLAKPGALLAIQLATYSGGYLLWWLAITPTSKAWLRRIVIGLLALAFLYLVLVGMVTDRMREPRTAVSPRRRSVGTIAWVLAGVCAFVVSLTGLSVARNQVLAVTAQTSARTQAIEKLADQVKNLTAQGNHVYGDGWWSAPVVSLYANVPLGNLGATNICDPSMGFTDGKAYLVWDLNAQVGASEKPQAVRVKFVEVPGTDTGYGGIWHIQLTPRAKCTT
ncbi:MAG: hypothetical protein ACR2P2_20820 [Nakamurella sp.]